MRDAATEPDRKVASAFKASQNKISTNEKIQRRVKRRKTTKTVQLAGALTHSTPQMGDGHPPLLSLIHI